jgi:hypothetical protein
VACSLRWADIDLECGNVHLRRIKNGDPSVHPPGLWAERCGD